MNQNRGVTTGSTERMNLTDPETNINQDNYSKNKGGFAFGSVGFDYFMTPRTTFSLTGIKVHGEFKPYDRLSIENNTLYPDHTSTFYSQRNSNSKRVFNANGFQFAFKHLFPREG
jgi:hypothetical protein